MLIFPLLFVVVSSEETAFRINEKLSTDSHFYEEWNDLIRLQEEQGGSEMEDYSSLYGSLSDCLRVSSRSQGIESLRIEDIQVFADAGHLSTFCRHNMTLLSKGDLDSCGHHSSSSILPTLDKLLRVFNPNLTVVDVHRAHGETLAAQMNRIGEKMQQVDNYQDKWKLVLIVPNIQDGEASEAEQTAIEVLEGIKLLAEKVPTKTLVVVLKNTGKGIWRDASHSHSACRILLERWKSYVEYNMETIWDQVDLIVQKNYQTSQFFVEILPLLNEASLAQLPNTSDLSALGYDCTHWSEKGLSYLHLAIWNSLLTSSSQRSKNFRPVQSELLCPDPRCPFIRSSANSALCLWNPQQDDSETLAPQLIAVAILALSLLLCLILVGFLCLRKDKGQLKKEKAFGSNFSSIRFIDDDI